MRRTRTLLTVSAGLILAAPGLASATSGSEVLVSGPSPYANCAVGGPGTNYVNAEVEPYVTVNPLNQSNLIGAWQQDRWTDGGSHGLVAGYSTDGGATWAETPLPFDACAPGGLPYTRASDPWVSVGPDGTAYANAIVFDETDSNNGVAAATSSDGGKTWKNLASIVSYSGTNQYFTDKNSITADPVRAGVAYSVWDTLTSPNTNPYADMHAFAYTGPGVFSETTDGGKSWSAPRTIFPTGERQQTIGNQIVADPANPGTLYDFANWIVQPNTPVGEQDQLAYVKSTDGGATWSAPRVITDLNDVPVTDPETGALIRTGDIIPEVAIGPHGQLAAVWQDGQFSGGAYEEVAYSGSTDGGATWSAPKRINTPTGRPSFNPQVHIAADGTVGVTYYDFRGLPAGDTTTLPTDYWFTGSADGGATWSAGSHVAGPFDLMAAPQAGGLFIGDYEGLTSTGSATFHPFYVRTTCPVPSTGPCNTADRTDVYASTVTP